MRGWGTGKSRKEPSCGPRRCLFILTCEIELVTDRQK